MPVVCRETTAELLRVLAYPKFRLAPADRMALLEDYLPYAEIVVLPDPAQTSVPTGRDPDDTVFLRLALAAQVPLVTGDGDLTDLRDATTVRLLSVTDLRDLIAHGASGP